jgi:hypothetical protein
MWRVGTYAPVRERVKGPALRYRESGGWGGIEVDGDDVEPGGLRVEPFAFAVGAGGGEELRHLGGIDGFGGEAGRAAAGADFDENEGLAVAGEEVDFAAADAEVAAEDGHAGGFETVSGDPLAEVAEAAPRGHHGRAACATGA